ALPVSVAGLVEVQVNVDEPWQHVEAACVNFDGAAREVRSDRGDPLAVDGDIGPLDAGRKHDGAAADDRHLASSSRRFLPASRASATSSSSTASSGWWLRPPGQRRNSMAAGMTG